MLKWVLAIALVILAVVGAASGCGHSDGALGGLPAVPNINP